MRRVALAGSAVLTLAALVLSMTDVMAVVVDRLAWGASVWAAGPVLAWGRAAISRRLNWRLVAAGAAVVCGIVWQPLVPALVAVALLAERAVRPSPIAAPGDGATAEGSLSPAASPIAGRLG